VCSCYVWVASENRVGKGSEYRAEFDRFIESISADERAKMVNWFGNALGGASLYVMEKARKQFSVSFSAQLPEQDGHDQ
jgi:hypothetical protein